jgi:hypothetical protein
MSIRHIRHRHGGRETPATARPGKARASSLASERNAGRSILPSGGWDDTAARLYGGNGHNTETIFFAAIDRPHSFRDDTQRRC